MTGGTQHIDLSHAFELFLNGNADLAFNLLR